MSGTESSPPVSFKDCVEPGPYCPVEATVLGYYPILGVNAFLAAGFALCGIALLGTGIWKRTWGYSMALAAGAILEFVGESMNAVPTAGGLWATRERLTDAHARLHRPHPALEQSL